MKPKYTTEAVRENIAETIIAHFPNASRRVMQEMSDEIIDLITAQQAALLDEVERRVIGKDVPTFKYIDHLINDKKRTAVNKLKTEQGKTLEAIKKEIV